MNKAVESGESIILKSVRVIHFLDRALITGATDSEMHYWRDVSLKVQTDQA